MVRTAICCRLIFDFFDLSHSGAIELVHVERLLNPAVHIDVWDEKANVGVKQRSAAENAQIRTVRVRITAARVRITAARVPTTVVTVRITVLRALMTTASAFAGAR